MRPQVIAFMVFVAVATMVAIGIGGLFMSTGPTENQVPSNSAPAGKP